MRRTRAVIFLFVFLSVISQGCQTSAPVRSEQQVTNIRFEIQGLVRPPDQIMSTKGLLKKEGELRVAAVGDLIPHQNVKKSASMNNIVKNGVSINNEGYDYLYEKVREILKTDITIANYESPLAPATGNSGRPFVFNSDIHFLSAARDANINVFNVANNHIYDQEIKGFEETLKIFKEKQIMYTGFYSRYNDKPVPLVIEKNGIKTAIFGFTTILNNLPDYKSLGEYVRKFEKETDIKAIEDAKDKYDIIIVYIHWGQEYMKEPDNTQREIAGLLAKAGADIIIGGHPHILQPFELLVSDDKRVVPVAFSMGNFISNQSRNYSYPVSGEDEGRTRDSAVLKFKIIKYSYGETSFSVISDLHFIPLWTSNNHLCFSKGIDEKLNIFVFPINERIEELKKMIDAEKDEKKKKELLLELENLLLRLKLIKSTLGEDFVR